MNGMTQSYLSGGDKFYRADVDAVSGQTGTVADLDGTVYHFNGGTAASVVGSTYSYLPAFIEDRNGNKVTVSMSGRGFTVADTLGRSVFSSSGFGTSGDSFSVSGQQQPYTLSWGTAPTNYTIAFADTGNTVCPAFSASDIQPVYVLTSLALPNGKFYQFAYDSTYGLLNKITYPGGGWIRYTWGPVPSSVRSLTVPAGQVGTPPCWYVHDWFSITRREVSFDGVNVALREDYSYSTSWSGGTGCGPDWCTKQTTVTATDVVRGETITTIYNYLHGGMFSDNNPYNSFPSEGESVPLERTVVYRNSGGAILQTVTKAWYDQDRLLACDARTLDNGLTSEAFYTYSGVMMTAKRQYDFGLIATANACSIDTYNAPIAPTITPTRETDTAYQAFASAPAYPYPPLDRPSSVKAYGNGTLVAETDFGYDETSVASVSPTPPAHDETNYGASSTAPRGNTTTVTRKCLQSCADAVTKYTYDETGQVLSVIDPCGNSACSDISDTNHTTTYSYADNFDSPPSGNTNAYLTRITRPTTSSGASHVQTFKYAYSDGQLITSTDENGQPTQYFYSDSLRRLTETDYPDGGKTTIAYNDAPYNPSTPSPSVITTKVATPSPNLITLTAFDGLGHTVRTVLTSDPDCASGDRTDTTYDGLGRVRTASNPYCTTNDPSFGVTTYNYDALGRTTQITQPDGSAITTSYSGNTTTVTDEAGKKRQSTTDGLGRLTQVVEDPGGLGYATTYSYDSLNNLTGVVQNGSRQRTFSYDSLSRLVQTINPESGITNYGYDVNGNLIWKTDARNVSVGYCYDALNRLACKVYSPNFSIGYYYDQTAPWGITLTNPISRLTTMGTYDGTCWPTASTFGYDAMGRPSFQEDYLNTAETSGCPGAWSTISASHDLAGNQISLTYPSGRVIKNQFNGVSRLTKVTTDDFNSYNYLGSANYAPHGAPTNFALGNGLTETTAYNMRLQPTQMRAYNPSTSPDLLNMTYGFNAGSADNGNVVSWSATGRQTFNRTYSYDRLNRLAIMSSPSDPTGCTGLSWTYDAWGNRTDQTVTGGSCNTFHATVTTQNQLYDPVNNIYQYDSTGNMTFDGLHHYTYDSEAHLTQVDSGGAATYTYDAEGRRMAKKIGSATTEYIYFNGDVLAEYNLGDQVWSDYIFAGGRRLAAAGTDDIFNPGFEQGLEGWRTWAGDSSGSEQVITDATRAHSGNKYLQLSTTTAQVWTGNQLIAVNPGDQLTFGGWAYLEAGSVGGAWVSWNLAVLDKNGNVLEFPTTGGVSWAAWTLLSANYTVPSGGASVWLYAQIYQPTGLITARFDDGFLTGASGLGVQYYHGDHLGSTRLITDASGNVVSSLDYLPFGEEWDFQSTSNHYKFTGKERDSESGLDNFGARYNSSSMGRFMSPDPGNDNGFENQDDPQSWNAYSYVRNNPLNLTDPDGRDYRVCVDNGSGEQNCTTYANFNDFQKALNGTGATLNGTDKNGQILVNDKGQSVVAGTYQFFVGPGVENGGTSEDTILAPLLFGGAVGAVRGLFRAGASLVGDLVGAGSRTAAEAATGGLTPGTVFNAGKGLLQGEAEMSAHAAEQAAARGVTQKEIAEALSHVPKQEAGRGSVVRFIGQAAEVRVNRITGTIVTVIRNLAPGAPSPLS